MKLANKTALLTGGGSGIGAGCAIALAREGCQVAIAGGSADKLAEVAKRFDGTPAIKAHPVDVADRASVADPLAGPTASSAGSTSSSTVPASTRSSGRSTSFRPKTGTGSWRSTRRGLQLPPRSPAADEAAPRRPDREHQFDVGRSRAYWGASPARRVEVRHGGPGHHRGAGGAGDGHPHHEYLSR